MVSKKWVLGCHINASWNPNRTDSFWLERAASCFPLLAGSRYTDASFKGLPHSAVTEWAPTHFSHSSTLPPKNRNEVELRALTMSSQDPIGCSERLLFKSKFGYPAPEQLPSNHQLALQTFIYPAFDASLGENPSSASLKGRHEFGVARPCPF